MHIEIRLAEVLEGHYDTHFGTGACRDSKMRVLVQTTTFTTFVARQRS